MDSLAYPQIGHTFSVFPDKGSAPPETSVIKATLFKEPDAETQVITTPRNTLQPMSVQTGEKVESYFMVYFFPYFIFVGMVLLLWSNTFLFRHLKSITKELSVTTQTLKRLVCLRLAAMVVQQKRL